MVHKSSNHTKFLCGAVILSEKLIVTTAHCLSDRYPNEMYRVRTGQKDLLIKVPPEKQHKVDLYDFSFGQFDKKY